VSVETAARELVGTRFRLHGRDPATGLDCVGVVGCALGRSGDAPTGYAMRGGSAGGFIAMLAAAGLVRVTAAEPGDVLLIEAGPRQYHLAIRTAAGFVHADAGLRRVVETPGMPRWPVAGIFRARV
jgi:lipoprotein Spr